MKERTAIETEATRDDRGVRARQPGDRGSRGGPLLAELGCDDVVRLSPPGFGDPLPAGFGATVEEYRAWLVDELEAFDTPVDLVGHDWGGGHVLGVAMTRPDLIRSWVSDAVALYDPDYVWHPLARQWQTPGVGEEAVAARYGADPAVRAEVLRRRGVRRDIAELLAAGQNETMGRAVLALYRSATQPVMADLGRDLAGRKRAGRRRTHGCRPSSSPG